MSDSSVIRSRYTKNEIISVMQGVAELIGTRKQKAHYSAEIRKITLQTTFLKEKAVALDDKLKRLHRIIEQTEITAKEPSETMLKLRSAKQTLNNEYNRFNEIARRSRELVNGKNKEVIDILSHEVDDLENQSLPGSQKQLAAAQQNNTDLRVVKGDYFSAMAKLHTDFRVALEYVTDELNQCSTKLDGLSKNEHDLAGVLDDLSRKKDEIANELLVLDGAILERQEKKRALEIELEKLMHTKERIDSLEDPKAYFADLSLQLKEDKLSLEAKQGALEAVQRISNEVEEINAKLEEGISEYTMIFSEFEETLAQI